MKTNQHTLKISAENNNLGQVRVETSNASLADIETAMDRIANNGAPVVHVVRIIDGYYSALGAADLAACARMRVLPLLVPAVEAADAVRVVCHTFTFNKAARPC